MIAITTPTGPTAFDAWGLAAAWVGSGAAVLGVGVAIIFGILTLANTRRSRSALDTATIAAAQSVPPGAAPGLRANGPQPIAWAVTRAPGPQRWAVVNDGTVDAVDVDLQGLTETDRRRLGAPVHAGTLAPSEQLEFPFASRFTLSGPGNIVVSWRTASDDTAQRTVLRVPAE